MPAVAVEVILRVCRSMLYLDGSIFMMMVVLVSGNRCRGVRKSMHVPSGGWRRDQHRNHHAKEPTQEGSKPVHQRCLTSRRTMGKCEHAVRGSSWLYSVSQGEAVAAMFVLSSGRFNKIRRDCEEHSDAGIQLLDFIASIAMAKGRGLSSSCPPADP